MSYLAAIEFRQPLWLLLVFAPLIKTFIGRLAYTDNGYADQHLLKWTLLVDAKSQHKSLISKKYMALLAWLFLCLSLSGPRTVQQVFGLEDAINTDLVVAIDLSRSMQVTDVEPSRIVVATTAATSLISRLQMTRAAIIVFSSTAHTMVPLTADKNVLLTGIKTIQPNMLPNEGTRPNLAIRQAINTLLSSKASNKNILLISDGGDREIIKSTSAITQQLINIAINKSIKLHTWGVGTEAGGGIPAETGGWVINNEEKVISTYVADYLQKLSAATDSIHAKLNRYNQEALIADINAQLLSNVATTSSSNNALRTWNEYYSILFIIACLFYFISKYDLRRNKSMQLGMAFIAVSLMLPGSVEKSYADDIAAYDAYQQGDYALAARLYSQQTGYHALMGHASARYKLNNYPQAINLYIQATLIAATDELRANALFNLANCYYQLGDYATAEKTYADSLVYRPGDKNTVTNRTLATLLRQRVEAEVKKLIINRAGKGPRKARLPQGTDTTGATISLSDDENETTILSAGSEQLTEQQRALISRGLEFATLSSNQTSAISNQNWRYHSSAAGDSPAYDSNNEYKLWKRLFEIEAGYPAPAAKPRIIDGVKPW